jgi:hypothetical protein
MIPENNLSKENFNFLRLETWKKMFMDRTGKRKLTPKL